MYEVVRLGWRDGRLRWVSCIWDFGNWRGREGEGYEGIVGWWDDGGGGIYLSTLGGFYYVGTHIHTTSIVVIDSTSVVRLSPVT